MLYSFLRAIFQVLFSLFGLKSEGLHNIAEKGPLILAANHVSYWDAIVVAAAVKRPIHFMGKAELFDYPLLGYFIKKLNAFPVRRGIADRNAIKKALLVLEEGKILGIFPEGMRNLKGEDLKAQAGVAMIALKSGAPVVPVACIGTNRILPLGWFRPLVVRVGDPIGLEEYQGQKVNSAAMEKLSSEIMTKINLLLEK